MTDATESAPRGPFSLLGKVEGAEKAFLAGRRNREADLESAVGFFLEFLRGFESFDFDRPWVSGTTWNSRTFVCPLLNVWHFGSSGSLSGPRTERQPRPVKWWRRPSVRSPKFIE